MLNIIEQYIFPMIAVIGMGGFIYYIWRWVTVEFDPVIGNAMTTVIKLVDRIRLLDNELIKMKMKIETTLELRQQLRDKELEEHRKQNQNPQK